LNANVFNWLSQLSISTWIKIDSTTWDDWIISTWGNSWWPTQSQLLLWHDDPNWLRFIGSDNWWQIKWDTWDWQWSVLTPWKWYHIVAILNIWNSISIYVNWSLDVTQTASAWTLFSSANDIFIWSESWWLSRLTNWDIWLTRIYNRVISQSEIKNLYQEWLRKIWPTQSFNKSQGFPKYSLPNIEEWKVLEISRPQSWGSYIDQTWNWNNSSTITNITDSTIGLHNVMTLWTNAYATFTDVWDESNLSAYCWVYVAWNTRERLLNKWQSGTNFNWKGWYFNIHPTAWKIQLNINPNQTEASYYRAWSNTDTINVWQWNFVWFTHNSSWTKFYINWAEVESVIEVWTIQSIPNNSSPFELFRINFDWPIYYSTAGTKVSNVGLVNRIMTPNEMQQSFYSNFIK